MSIKAWINTVREFPGDPRRTEPAGARRSNDRDGGQRLDTPNRSPEATASRRDTAVEMARLWKSQTDFHSRLEISHSTRDSHISTSRLFVPMIKERTDGQEAEARDRN
jgi:hypothetical protein